MMALDQSSTGCYKSAFSEKAVVTEGEKYLVIDDAGYAIEGVVVKCRGCGKLFLIDKQAVTCGVSAVCGGCDKKAEEED